MSSTLLVLGGDAFALPVLRWAREAGLEVVLVDPDPRAPARRLAHEFHVVPRDDAEAHAALAKKLARAGLTGILPAHAGALPLLPLLAGAAPDVLPPRRALELLLAPERTRESLRKLGFRVAEGGAHCLDVFAFFRDGAFVPGGIAARRRDERGDLLAVQPAALSPEREHAAYVLVERVARALGLERGLLQATLTESDGELALVALAAGCNDLLGAGEVARLAHGKSPLQAWFAHLAGAGGPFDEFPRTPRAAAGWLALAPPHAGLFAGCDGVAQARSIPGVAGVWLIEPGRELGPDGNEPLGWLWAAGHDHEELEQRLRAARAALEVRVACRQVA